MFEVVKNCYVQYFLTILISTIATFIPCKMVLEFFILHKQNVCNRGNHEITFYRRVKTVTVTLVILLTFTRKEITYTLNIWTKNMCTNSLGKCLF